LVVGGRGLGQIQHAAHDQPGGDRVALDGRERGVVDSVICVIEAISRVSGFLERVRVGDGDLVAFLDRGRSRG
jgi:hypothetical protein